MKGSEAVRLHLFSTGEVAAVGEEVSKVQGDVETGAGVEEESRDEKDKRIGKEHAMSRQPKVTRAPAAPTQKQLGEH